jgi:anti-sigma regulatory factor (Ser/Thr protein kinase)
MKPVESVMILPSRGRFVNPALAFVRAIAASCGLSESVQNDIEIASEEAIICKYGSKYIKEKER